MAIVDKYISHITPLGSSDTYKLKAYLLKNGRTFKVKLDSTNASTAFDGSANIADIGVTGILKTTNGGTGNNSFTQNRVIYSETNTKLSSANSIYADATHMSINQTSITSGQTFEVTGKAHINDTTSNNGTTATPPAFSVGTLIGTNIGISPTGIQAKNNATTSTLYLNYYGSSVIIGQPSTPAATTIHGLLTLNRTDITYTTEDRGTLIPLIQMKYKNTGTGTYTKNILAAIETSEAGTTVDQASIFLGSSGGSLVLGAGESAATVQKNNNLNQNENIYLIADTGTKFYVNANQVANAKHEVTIDTNGLTIEQNYLRMRPYSATYNQAAADVLGSIFFNHDGQNYPADTFITGSSIRAAQFIVRHDHLTGDAPTANKSVVGIKWTDKNNILMSRIRSYKWKDNATHHGLYFDLQSAASDEPSGLFSLHADDSLSDIYYISISKRINTSLNISATAGYTDDGTNGAGSTLFNNGKLYLNSVIGNWTYTRLNNGTYLWDIATNSSSNTSSLQFRNNSSGSMATYVRFDLNGSIYTGNLTIGGKVDTDPGKTIVSSSTLYLKTSGNAGVVFATNAITRAKFDNSGHFIPETTNTYNLGTQGSKRWKALFIGTADSYGGIEKPIYWNNGVPTVTNTVNILHGGTPILANTDLNTLMTVGNYYCAATADAKTLTGIPIVANEMSAFTMKIGYATGTGYTYQQIHFYNTHEVYRRYNTTTTNTTKWQEWVHQTAIPMATVGIHSLVAGDNIDNLSSFTTYYSQNSAVTANLTGTKPFNSGSGFKLYNISNYFANYHQQIITAPATGFYFRQRDNSTSEWREWKQMAYVKATTQIGSGINPVYAVSGGSITASTANVGGTQQFVYMVNGSITATTTSVGGTEQPIYSNAGVLTNTTYHLKAHIEDGTQYRAAYYSDIRKIEDAGSIYMTSSTIGVNQTSITSGQTFEVTGKAHINDTTSNNGTTATPPAFSVGTLTGTHIGISPIGIQAKDNAATSTLYLNYYGSPLIIGQPDTPANTTVHGTVKATAFGVAQKDGDIGLGISLYNGPNGTGKPTYGLFFGHTKADAFNTHGLVGSNDWATYFTMDTSNSYQRGWIFQCGTVNVGSLNGRGQLYIGQNSYEARVAATSTAGNIYLYSSATDSISGRGVYSVNSNSKGVYAFYIHPNNAVNLPNNYVMHGSTGIDRATFRSGTIPGSTYTTFNGNANLAYIRNVYDQATWVQHYNRVFVRHDVYNTNGSVSSGVKSTTWYHPTAWVRIYSPNTSAATSNVASNSTANVNTGKFEGYWLPNVDLDRTESRDFSILTSKNELVISYEGEYALNTSTNIDSLPSRGTYYAINSAITANVSGTKPVSGAGFKLFDIRNYSSSYDYQIATTSIEGIYYRHKTNASAWGVWHQIALSNNNAAFILNQGSANRIAWYSAAGTISSGSIVTDGGYLGSISYLSVNIAHQTSYRLYVNGTSYFNGNTTHNGIDYFANGTTYYIDNSANANLQKGTFNWLRVINNSSNNSDDAVFYIENKNSNDWAQKINLDTYNYGLKIMGTGTNLLSIGTNNLLVANENATSGSGNIKLNGTLYFANGTTYYINNSGTGNLNALTVNNTTASTTTGTGGLIVKGGAGIAGRVTASEFNATRPMVVSAGKVYSNISGSNVLLPAKTTMLFSNGIAIANPGLTSAADVGWLRVTGTAETDTVLELATGDDGGNGKTIHVRQYNTSNAIVNDLTLLDTLGNTQLGHGFKFYYTTIPERAHINAAGWWKIAHATNYFTFDIYINGNWHTGSPSVTIVNITQRNGTAIITQKSGLAGDIGSQIKLGKTATNEWDVLIYIPQFATDKNLGQQYYTFVGIGGLTLYQPSTRDTTTYSAETILELKTVSGVVGTTNNISWDPWTPGSSAGPQANLNIAGTVKTSAAIPNASATASGVVTNAAQTFGGAKTFQRATSDANAAGVAITHGRLSITNYSNTLIIGSYNSSWAHFESGQPFWFNNDINVQGDLKPYVTTGTRSLGVSGNRWKALYVGTHDSYGDGEQPIYWDAGVPKATSYYLKANVSNATQWGVAYYSAARTITSTGQGTNNYVLTASGAAAPKWTAQSALSEVAATKTTTLAWSTTSTIATIGGNDIKVTMPDNPNTDAKVSQSKTETDSWRKILLHYTKDSASNSAVTSATNVVYAAVGGAIQPSTGTLAMGGNIIAGTYTKNTDGTSEHQIDARGGAGRIYLFSAANHTTGNRGIYSVNANGNGMYAFYVQQNNALNFPNPLFMTTSTGIDRNLIRVGSTAANTMSAFEGNTSRNWVRYSFATDGWIYDYHRVLVRHNVYNANGNSASGVKSTSWYQPKVWWRVFSPNTSAATVANSNSGANVRTAYYEDYSLPEVTPNRTESASYTILTTKNYTSYVSPAANVTSAAATGPVKYYLLGQEAAGDKKVYIATANSSGSANTLGVYFQGSTGVLRGAAWNDYAEYRKAKEENIKPGQVVYENGDDTLSITTDRLQRGCSIVSDTFGIGIGESFEQELPIAVSGRVLAYPYENKEEFKNHIGWPVCSGPNGTVSIMTEEEEIKYPSRIIGTISAVPDYEIWHGGTEVVVDGRIWIKVK